MRRSIAILVGALTLGGLVAPAHAQYGYMPAPYYPNNPYAVPYYVPGYVPYPGAYATPQVPIAPVENWNNAASIYHLQSINNGRPVAGMAIPDQGGNAPIIVNPRATAVQQSAETVQEADQQSRGETKSPFKLASRCKDGSCAPVIHGDSCCADACCAPPCHDPCGDPCGRAGGFYAGGGVLYVQPRWDNNPAFLLSQTVGTTTFTTQTDIEYDWLASPRAWIGYACDGGIGIRGRGWYYSQTEDLNVSPAAGDTLLLAAPLGVTDLNGIAAGNSALAHSLLHLYTADLETTLELLRDGRWSLLASGGARYVFLSQRYDVTELDAAGNATDLLQSGHRFEGVGPTVSMEAMRQVGGSNFSIYSNSRGSVMFGRGRQSALAVDSVNGTILAGSISQDRVLPIFEVEAGLEWAYDMGAVRLVAQTGAVGQVWFNAGNSSDSSPTVGDPNANSRSNLGFIGLSGMLGFRY